MQQREINIECGTCDYEINQPDKLQSHYMAVHGLSNRDADLLTSPYHSHELTFEQTQKIDHLSLLANTRGSNQNRYRIDLHAYVEELLG